MEFKELKSAMFTSPQNGSKPFERYVVENEADLKAFFKVFASAKSMMYKSLERSLNEGYIILLTDVHPLTKMPTYCFEETDQTNTHTSCFFRVK